MIYHMEVKIIKIKRQEFNSILSLIDQVSSSSRIGTRTLIHQMWVLLSSIKIFMRISHESRGFRCDIGTKNGPIMYKKKELIKCY